MRLPILDWQSEGVDPDYRFSLANERTFLAWFALLLGTGAGVWAMVTQG